MKPLIFVLSYLLGSVPFGLLLARLKGVDPRKGGSGNIGATNVMRTAGKGLGALTLLADVGKGAVPVALAKALYGPETAALSGLFAFLGHLFPLYLRFRGGKGVATAVGVYLILAPWSLLVGVGVFLVAVSLSRMVSVGSLLGAIVMPIFLRLLDHPPAVVLVSILISAFVFLKHIPNIKRILSGKEHRL